MSPTIVPAIESLLAAPATAGVHLVQLDELPLLHVRNAHARALIALQGAQVLTYAAHGQRPLIWLSEQAQFRRGAAVRGGIPVCWPWFGDLARNPEPVRALHAQDDAPAHGLVRARDWLLTALHETADCTEITLCYPVAILERPWRAQLELTIRVGAGLHLQLTTRNRGAQPLALTQALHTYFAIGDIDRVEILDLEQTRYLDTLAQWRERRQEGALRIEGEVDRIYLDTPARIRIRDALWRRTLHLQVRGSRSAVVWNPWIEKSLRLSQFAGDAWRRMLCIETANVMDDQIALAAGAEHRMEVEIHAENFGQ